jgi:hypothetical protein
MALVKRKISKTQAIVNAMLVENTGRSLCDSGDYYGRNYDINRKQGIPVVPRSLLNFKYDSINVVHRLAAWLPAMLEYNPTIQRKFTRFANLAENKDSCWLEVMQKYMEKIEGKGVDGDGDSFVVNSYNGEDLLSQTIQYCYWTDDNGAHVLLQVHGGCDVRGGYTAPKAFDVGGEYGSDDTAVMDNAKAGIYCTGKDCESSWYTDDGYHWYANNSHEWDTELDKLDRVELEDGQTAVEVIVARKATGLDRALIVDSDGNGYCPDCGEKLAADFG